MAGMAQGRINPRIVGRYALVVMCVAIFAAFMIYPMALTLLKGFQETGKDGQTSWTLRYLLDVFRDPLLRQGLVNSVMIAVCVTGLCLLISIPLAVVATTYEFRGKAMFSALLLVPLILPPFVGTIGLRQILGRFGALNALLIELGLVGADAPIDFLGGARFWGVVAMEALHLYPIVYLNTTAALANLDPAMEQAADNLGCSRWKRFTRITLPLILPGLFAGGTIVFIWSFTELGTPLMFDYYTVTPVQVFFGIQEITSSPRPYALVVVMLTAAVALYALSKRLFGRQAYAMATRAGTAAITRRLGGWRSAAAAAPFLAVTLLAVMPHIGVIITSFTKIGQGAGGWYRSMLPEAMTTGHYLGALTHDLASTSIRNSLLYSSLAMLVDLALGLLIAWLIVRGRVRGATLLDGLSMLPLAVPGLVLAFGYVAMSIQITGWFPAGTAPTWLSVVGENPNPIVFLVIAYAIRRLPYVVRSAVAGLQQTSGELEEAAVNLGASPLYAMRRIIVPLILANLIAGGLLAFSFAMLEVSDSLLLAQTEKHFPITKAIYALFERLGDGPYIASAMGVWGMALLTLTLVGASLMLGKKMGAIFRV
jgi:iron(III) transport system permease protein